MCLMSKNLCEKDKLWDLSRTSHLTQDEDMTLQGHKNKRTQEEIHTYG